MLGQNIGRVGLPDMSAGGRPSLTLDFVSIPVLNEKITFSRASGATWFSPDGVLKGVDFSTTSVAIGTGSKSFTLTATAGVNRYWAVNDLVRVSQQSNSANFMEGTVTSYTASTQVLVIDVTSTGGSGTIASWRVASHMPRLDYNPSTLAARGLLIEEARTNSIRNNTMVGAAAGTPGTLPTNWQVSGLGTLTQEITGIGTENGISYIDIKFSGTTSTTGLSILFESATQIVATNGQTWISSQYVKIQNGSTTNITNIRAFVRGLTALGTQVESNGVVFSPTSTLVRYIGNITLANATSERVQPFINIGFSSGVAIDITLRIGLPQLELGAFATSVIPTTNALALGVTRSADVASVNTLSPWFNASSGTLYGEITDAAITVSGVARRIATIGDAPNTDIIAVAYAGATGVSTAFVTDNNVNQASFVSPSGAYAQPTKVALAYAANDFQASVNGSAFSAVTSGTVPTVTQMSLGDAIITAVGRNLNGHLRRVTYYPRRLSQAELIAITA